MRQELEAMRDKLVQEIATCDYGRTAALMAHDAITEFIEYEGYIDCLDSNITDMQREINELKAAAPVTVIEAPLPTPICVATFAQVRKAIVEALNVAATKGSPANYTLTDAARTGRKLSSRKGTAPTRARKPKGKTPRPVARKRQSRRA